MGLGAIVIPHIMLGPRMERYWVELLTKTDVSLFNLDGVEGGTVEYNYDSRIKSGFKLDLVELGQGINWLQHRLRPWVEVNGQSWPLGVYIPNSPQAQYDSTRKRWSVSCLDKTSALDLVKVPETYSVGKDANVTTLVSNLISASSESGAAVTPSDKTTREMMVWPPNTSALSIINELLWSINYTALWTDGYGQFRAEPYVGPAERPLIGEFREGEFAIHSPVFTREQDIASVPNRVIVIAQGTDTEPPLVGEAYNTDESSPYSYQSRGGWITRSYETEASDQETIDAQAARYLALASTPIATLEVEHAVVPLDGSNRVRFVSADIDVFAVVNEYQITMQVGSLMSGKWNEVLGE